MRKGRLIMTTRGAFATVFMHTVSTIVPFGGRSVVKKSDCTGRAPKIQLRLTVLDCELAFPNERLRQPTSKVGVSGEETGTGGAEDGRDQNNSSSFATPQSQAFALPSQRNGVFANEIPVCDGKSTPSFPMLRHPPYSVKVALSLSARVGP